MQCFHGIIVEAHSPIFQFLSFYFGHTNYNSINKIYSFFAVSFEVVAMINLIDELCVLQSHMNQIFHDLNTLLLELSEEAE